LEQNYGSCTGNTSGKGSYPQYSLGHLNTYLIQGKEGWVMIDTGWYTPEAFDSLNKGLRDLGLVLSDIDTIIMTHIHPDHFGLAGRIKHASPATKLLMHQLEADLMNRGISSFPICKREWARCCPNMVCHRWIVQF